MLRVYNTHSKKIEEVVPRESGIVRMYTCGPTVYRYAHLGNLRSYLMADWIRRTLESDGFRVVHVKNITDVGHMRQEALETGGDKMILAALAEGKTPNQIAEFYTDAFQRDEERLNILPASEFPRATDHVPEMVSMIEQLIAKEYAYEAGDNIYFDVNKFAEYGKLSGNLQEGLLEGVRVEVDPNKKDPRDFTLWKAAEPDREVKWETPWGEGFPGWHIECSAMSKKYLGEQLDIHTGGVDNIFPHHEGEIAQSEATSGKPFVRYWVHGQHLLADGIKMAKSAGNEFILADIEKKGIDPLAFRYLCLTVRYRHRMNFTLSALKAAERALRRLRDRVWLWRNMPPMPKPPEEVKEWKRRFFENVHNDLDLPNALRTTWDMLRSDLPDQAKLNLLLEFDGILGLSLDGVPARYRLPDEISESVDRRSSMRKQVEFEQADKLRSLVRSKGYSVRDTETDTLVRPASPLEQRDEQWTEVSSSREVTANLDVSARLDFSFVVTANDYLEDVKRCTQSVLKWANGGSTELVVVDNGSTDGVSQWLEELKKGDSRVRVVHCDHFIGEGAAKNIGIKLSLGRNVVLLDTSVEVSGDPTAPIDRWLEDETIGIVGPWGLRSSDLNHFDDEVESGEADAMQGYCMAFRRSRCSRVGLARESFRFYRNLDLDFSFQFRALGYRIVADGTLPFVRHEHRQWSALAEVERDQLSAKNFKRFLKRWGDRRDLLVAGKETASHHDSH